MHYKKDLMVTVGPTANPATVNMDLYPMTVEGQCRFLTELAAALGQVPEGRGKGFVYWEPAWLPVPGCLPCKP